MFRAAMRRALLVLLVFLEGCHCGNEIVTGGSGGGNSASGGGGAMKTLTSISLSPSTATIDVVNDTSTPQAFTVTGTYSDGSTMPVTGAILTLDSFASVLGSLNSGATFTANNNYAGTGSVKASFGGQIATAVLTVTIHEVRADPSAADAGTPFTSTPATGGTLSQTLDYPLDNAVMPYTVHAPVVQWEGPSAVGDFHRVVLSTAHVTVEGLVLHDAAFTASWQPDAHDWNALVSDGDVSVVVDHYDAASSTAERSQKVTVKIVKADVTGTIYYWDLSEGKMQRIDGNGRTLLIPGVPAAPDGSGNRCIACHTISQDGRYLSAELWGGNDPGAVFDLSNPATFTSDPAPTVTPAPTLAPLAPYVPLFSTFNPDASRLLINSGNALVLIDPLTGMPIDSGGTLPTDKASHPSWSRDGTVIVYIANHDGAWGVDYTQGDVALLPVMANDRFGAPQVLVSGAAVDPSVKAASWPTFTPDSQFIAYGGGSNSRGRNAVDMGGGNVQEVIYPGTMFMVPRVGGTPVRLDTACAGQLNCYLPNFSPYDSGGYFWLVFYSLRDYGNPLAGTKGVAPPRRQMWVTAIDKSKLGTSDPSSVPYWLPEQDFHTENMSAVWALPPPIQ